MAKSPKCISTECKYREHNDFTRSARCQLIANFASLDRSSTPLLPPSACKYCLEQNNQDPQILDEPFKSYFRKIELDPVAYEPEMNQCKLLIPLNEQDWDVPIQEYAEAAHLCRVWRRCTITPTSSPDVACNSCPKRFQVEHLTTGIDKILPVKKRHGDPIKKWAVGVTTAPRSNPTLQRSLHTLKAAGWDIGLIFAEPTTRRTEFEGWPVVWRQDTLGIFRNFILGLQELFLRNLDADAFMMVQDDILFPKGAKEYLERYLWPEDNPHIVTLFTPDVVDDSSDYGWKTTDFYNAGPTVLIMSHETVQEIISDVTWVIRYYIKANNSSFDDLGIFYWANHNKHKVYYPQPSLVDHVGYHSSHCAGQKESVMWSTKVAAPQATHSVDHFYVDGDRETEIERIRNNTKAKWIITTRKPKNVTILDDFERIVARDFRYEPEWFNPSIGYVNGELRYVSNSPCLSRVELLDDDFETCLDTSPGYVRQIEDLPMWSIECS